MSRIARVATVAGNADLEAELARDLELRSDVTVVLRCVDRVEVLAATEGGSLDGFVAVGLPLWLDREAVVSALTAGISVLVVTGVAEEASLAIEWGCEVLESADTDGVVARLRAMDPTTVGVPDPAPRGRLVAVWGPKGAPGRTRVAIELAYLAGAAGNVPALVDMDLYGADIAQLLDMRGDAPTIGYIARHPDELRCLEDHSPDWALVVPGSLDPSQWKDVLRARIEQLLMSLRSLKALTIADVGFDLDPVGRSTDDPVTREQLNARVVAEADRVVAVFRGDPVGVRAFLWACTNLRRIIDLNEVIFVANQVRPGDERALDRALTRHLGRRADAILPLRVDRVADAVKRGVPIARADRSSDLVTRLEPIAEMLGVPVPPKGLLARMGARM